MAKENLRINTRGSPEKALGTKDIFSSERTLTRSNSRGNLLMQYEREKHATGPKKEVTQQTSSTAATASSNTQPGTKGCSGGGSVISMGTPSRTNSQTKTGTPNAATSSGKEARLSGGRCYSSSKISVVPSSTTATPVLSLAGAPTPPVGKRLKRISEGPEGALTP